MIQSEHVFGALMGVLIAVVLFAVCSMQYDLGVKAGRYQCMNHPTDSACVSAKAKP